VRSRQRLSCYPSQRHIPTPPQYQVPPPYSATALWITPRFESGSFNGPEGVVNSLSQPPTGALRIFGCCNESRFNTYGVQSDCIYPHRGPKFLVTKICSIHIAIPVLSSLVGHMARFYFSMWCKTRPLSLSLGKQVLITLISTAARIARYP